MSMIALAAPPRLLPRLMLRSSALQFTSMSGDAPLGGRDGASRRASARRATRRRPHSCQSNSVCSATSIRLGELGAQFSRPVPPGGLLLHKQVSVSETSVIADYGTYE